MFRSTIHQAVTHRPRFGRTRPRCGVGRRGERRDRHNGQASAHRQPQVRQLSREVSNDPLTSDSQCRRRQGQPERRLTLPAQHQAEPRVRSVHGAAQLARCPGQADLPGSELRSRLVSVGRAGGRARQRPREDPDDHRRPDLRCERRRVAAEADQHIPPRLLVQRPERRGALRVRRHQADALQRRAQRRPAGDDQRA